MGRTFSRKPEWNKLYRNQYIWIGTLIAIVYLALIYIGERVLVAIAAAKSQPELSFWDAFIHHNATIKQTSWFYAISAITVTLSGLAIIIIIMVIRGRRRPKPQLLPKNATGSIPLAPRSSHHSHPNFLPQSRDEARLAHRTRRR